MDNTAHAPERAALEAPTTAVPAGWAAVQDDLSAGAGLALLLVEGHQPPSLKVSNNNSICRAFQSSPAHAHLCEPYCGVAYERAREKGAADHYRCHAGLHCFALPVELGTGTPLAVIGGRAFLRSADYRALAERIRTGDLTDLLSEELFNNVIFALRQDLDELAERVSAEAAEFVQPTRAASATPAEVDGAGAGGARHAFAGETSKKGAQAKPEIADAAVVARVAAQGVSLREFCERALASLIGREGLRSLALLLRSEDAFRAEWATGDFRAKPPRVALKAKEIKLLQAATQGESIAVPASGRTSAKHEDAVELFPLLVGDEIKAALLVGDRELTGEQRRAVAALCREIAMPLEVLRLREELERRMRAATHLQAFTELVNTSQPEEAYNSILRHSAELLHAERGSLLLFDERAGELEVMAAVGPRADIARQTRIALGDGVAGAALREGRPLVVRDVGTAANVRPAPAERSYKTNSFISYPITIGGRKVGVLNVTDKAGGGVYDEVDLTLLDMIAPQMALALDRAGWHQKATQFQLLSITDPLTGLVNRRYLEERLSEEVERSKRHRFAMSFLMMDIDDFKHYNDRHGHQAGDLALEMTAQCLKTALRSADTAARYGGEEFSILLPQTGISEARVIAERIRRRVERTHFPQGKSQPLGAVTVSIGVSAFGPELDTPASVIYAADQALYVAKGRGKNCVEVFEAKELGEASGEGRADEGRAARGQSKKNAG